MAVPNSEFPNRGPLAATGAAGNRPIPLGGKSGPATNRPIPLKGGPSDEVPDAHDDYGDEDSDDLREILRNAPAWLISTVFHMLLLIVLGLMAVTHLRSESRDVAISYAEEPDYAEQLGTQMEDPSVTEGNSPHVENAGPEQIITPRDLPPVDDPLAAPPNIGDLTMLPVARSGLAAASSPIKDAPMIGWALSGRRAGSKNVLLGKYGGTAGTEKAVELGLQWLAKQQKSDGTWSLQGPYKDGAQGESNAAATAMALLAFQGHGDTYKEGTYQRVVSKGWTGLLKLQRKDGLFRGSMAEPTHMLYTHAQCTIALCELYGMTRDPAFKAPALRALEYALNAQSKEYGGWRYTPGEDSDTSVTGWFVMALQSARMANLSVPDEALKRVMDYLDKAQIEGGERYGYWQTANPTMAMTAEGLLCREYLGWKQDDARLQAGVKFLNANPIEYDGGQKQDAYYWYYATQATHHIEGEVWNEWNKVMRKEVPAHQVKTGAEAGSWDPQGDKWGPF